MIKMVSPKRFSIIGLVNVIFVLAFSFVNYREWDTINRGVFYMYSRWSAFHIGLGTMIGGYQAEFLNLSFVVFLVSTIVNLLFMRIIGATQEAH